MKDWVAFFVTIIVIMLVYSPERPSGGKPEVRINIFIQFEVRIQHHHYSIYRKHELVALKKKGC
jgi:hypothetical protein